jgi:hypothetical protein
MSLTKVTYAMIDGAPFNVLDYGAVPGGVVDATTAIQAAFNAAAAARPASAETYVVFPPGSVFLISAKISVTDVSIQGNGATLVANTAFTMMEINGNGQMYTDLNLRFASEQSSSAAIALKLTDGVQQASKNTYINIITRNAYNGFYNLGGSAAAGSIWGSVFINCRADFAYDWGWYLNTALGATTCRFDTCYSKGSASGSQSKGFYINNIAEVSISNIAIDQVNDGNALQINTAFSVNVDSIALESCFVTTSGGGLVSIAANTYTNIRSIINSVCTYNVGVGNNAYILLVSSGSFVDVGDIQDNTPTITSGTVFKMRTNSNSRVKTDNVALSSTDTLGNFELFFDFSRFKGLTSVDPTGTWTKTYEVGDIAWNRAPTAGGIEPIGWVCTVAGTPGTWAAFGTIA